MNITIPQSFTHHPIKFLQQYKAKGKRRLNASLAPEDQLYIDPRNLWKASTISQEKQYESIRNSGLLNNNRKITFMKFNYRNAEERNLGYPEIFKIMTNRPQHFYQSKQVIRSKRAKKGIDQFKKKVSKEMKENLFSPSINWLQEYHQTQITNNQPLDKKVNVSSGTMNISDLWGERQLQECLGFLPCKRDRPKMLKFYSTNMKLRKQNMKGIERFHTDFFQD